MKNNDDDKMYYLKGNKSVPNLWIRYEDISESIDILFKRITDEKTSDIDQFKYVIEIYKLISEADFLDNLLKDFNSPIILNGKSLAEELRNKRHMTVENLNKMNLPHKFRELLSDSREKQGENHNEPDSFEH